MDFSPIPNIVRPAKPILYRGRRGPVEEPARIVYRIRPKWSQVKISLQGDLGSRRKAIMARREGDGIDYVLGLAKKGASDYRIFPFASNAAR